MMSQAAENLIKAKEANGQLNAFIYLPETPLEPLGEGLLSGLTLAVKDNIMLKDWPVTAASNILKGHIAAYDATVVEKIRRAGATIIGKSNLDEFAMGSSTETSAYGPSKNPWDTTLVPGGSSGGSAVAVGAGLTDLSLGSDTGGSIRQPAAFCGITGLKPTYGTVSRYGLIALASSLDVIGPFAKDAANVEKLFQVICGKDPYDQTTVNYQYSPTEIRLNQLKVGLPKELWEIDIDPEIKSGVMAFVDWLKKKGAQVNDVSLPSVKYGLPTYYIILPAEAMANLERYDGIRFQSSVEATNLIDKYVNTRSNGFGAEVKRRILLGTYALSVGHYDQYFQSALKARQLITHEHQEAFAKVDVLVCATTPTLPFALGEKSQDPLAMYHSDLLTVSANLAGVPAISLPVGFSKSGIPIGGQVIAPRFNENVLIDLVKQYQQEHDYHLKTPGGNNE